MIPSPRIEVADIARGIAILLVVFAHSLEIFMARPHVGDTLFSLWKGIYGFHLPFFFLVSGYLSKTRSWPDVVKSALNLIFVSLLLDGPAWLIKHHMGIEKAWSDYLNDIALLHGFALTVTWFLPALGLIRVLDHLLHAPYWALRGLSLVILCGGFWWHQISFSNAFQIGALLPGLLLFELGRWLKSRSWKLQGREHSLFWLMSGLGMIRLAFWLDGHNKGCLIDPKAWCRNIGDPSLVGHLGPQNAVFMMFGDIGFFPSFLTTAVIGSLGIMFLALATLRLRSVFVPLKVIGQKSLALLLLNGFFLSLVEIPFLKPFQGLDAISAANGLALSLIITLLHLLLLPIAERLFRPFITLALTLSRLCVGLPRLRKAPKLGAYDSNV